MSSTLSLYALDGALAEIEAELAEAGGEISDDLDARLNQLLDAREDKARAYVALIRSFEASAEAVAAERARLQAREKALAGAAQRLKDRLTASMQERGEIALECELGRIRLQYASRRAVRLLCDLDELPDEFRRVTVDADRGAIERALRGTESGRIDGLAELEPPKPFVRIY